MTGIGLTAGTAGTTLESWLLPLPPNGTVGEIWGRAWSSSLIGMLIFTCRFTLGTGCPIADMPTSAWQAALSGMLGLDGMAHAIQRNPGTSLPGGLRIFRLWADRLRQTQTQHIPRNTPNALSPMLSSGDVSARCPPGNKRSASRCSERARGVRSIHSSRHLGGPIAVQGLLTRGVRVQGTWFSWHHNDAVWPRFGRSSDKKLTK